MAKTNPNAGRFISLRDISLRLYGRVLFEHTTWELLDDQHWAVVGANGSGKSTLVKALWGRVPVVKGEISYHFLQHAHSEGAEAISLPQDHIAYVSFEAQTTTLQGTGLFYQARWNSGVSKEGRSVSEYLSEHLVKRINPYEVRERHTDSASFLAQRARIIELLEIQGLLGRDLSQLSNGERRKVLLARALIGKPRLLILDNPFTGLDAQFRHRLGRVIDRLMQDEMRVMVVTARQDEILPGITHVLVVENCTVIARGPRDQVLAEDSARRILNPVSPRDPEEVAHDQRPQKPDAGSQVLVQMRDVDVSYNGTHVLSRIHWTVRSGEHWALLGPNGAGKTTLLSLILGDHPQAYANEITLFGRRRGSGESIWEIKQRIGWVSPELHLYYPKRGSCLDVVCSGFYDSVGLYRRPSQAQRDIARSWMRRIGLLGTADTPFSAVSEGEQRMLLIARALVKHPLLLIFDEPCQGLDAGNRDQVLRTIDSIGQHLEASVLYVTHHAGELPRIISHVMRLDQGQIAALERLSRGA